MSIGTIIISNPIEERVLTRIGIEKAVITDITVFPKQNPQIHPVNLFNIGKNLVNIGPAGKTLGLRMIPII